ncbi:50S ribosomal protein L6 [Limihaloglobus sulfuriphilus]|uniref:Large ribosomal subunit protein uL6 n=1 Tax=Limihaloglobus sulfuriphilus TaxID=1851148 RepID=A0A1Q2MH70_9BACT|nr:50S ribosomal protein L6 [Limihaloglobus sulfuriphilus]AQQ72041.1 50S ribosomal protein L6 [Limihaloglobus sulfuriphilus]
MSRIGKKPIEIPAGVKVETSGGKLKVSGPKGSLEMKLDSSVDLAVEDNQITVDNPKPQDRHCCAMHGTIRALVSNMIVGVSSGFSRKMQMFGTGYNLKEQGGKLVFNAGYCHNVEIAIPKSVSVEIKTPATRGNDVPAEFTVSGYDKRELGQFCSEVRAIRPPEPYKGKGIRYADEFVRRKVGKAFGAGG